MRGQASCVQDEHGAGAAVEKLLAPPRPPCLLLASAAAASSLGRRLLSFSATKVRSCWESARGGAPGATR